MLRRFSLSLAAVVFALISAQSADAARAEFTPKITTYLCEHGVIAPPMECQPFKTEFAQPVVIEMMDLGNEFAHGSWIHNAKPFPAVSSILITRYRSEESKKLMLSLSIGAGWDQQYKRNGFMFMTLPSDQIPEELMFAGDRKKVGNKEVVAFIEIKSLKIID